MLFRCLCVVSSACFKCLLFLVNTGHAFAVIFHPFNVCPVAYFLKSALLDEERELVNVIVELFIRIINQWHIFLALKTV